MCSMILVVMDSFHNPVIPVITTQPMPIRYADQSTHMAVNTLLPPLLTVALSPSVFVCCASDILSSIFSSLSGEINRYMITLHAVGLIMLVGFCSNLRHDKKERCYGKHQNVQTSHQVGQAPSPYS